MARGEQCGVSAASSSQSTVTHWNFSEKSELVNFLLIISVLQKLLFSRCYSADASGVYDKEWRGNFSSNNLDCQLFSSPANQFE